MKCGLLGLDIFHIACVAALVPFYRQLLSHCVDMLPNVCVLH